MSIPLTSGSILQMLSGAPLGLSPVVQVLSLTEIVATKDTNNGTNSNNPSGAVKSYRARLALSDGINIGNGITNNSLSEVLLSGLIQPFSVIRINEHTVNFLSERKVLILSSVDHLYNPGFKIGNPASLPGDVGGSAANTFPTMMSSDPQIDNSSYMSTNNINKNIVNNYAVPAPTYSSSVVSTSPNVSLSGGNHTVPISALTPYSNRWTIKVRVSNKGEVKTWNNNKGSGSMFKVDLIDESGGEISAAFFKEAVTKFYDIVKQDKVYYMAGGRVKVADSRYSNGRTYEINFDEKASIMEASDDSSIKRLNFNFVSIATIANIEVNRTVDILGVITHSNEIATINTKAGKTMSKRDVTVIDNSSVAIDMTVWGEKASLGYSPGTIVVVKGARVTEWNGKSLATQQSSHIETNPDIPEAHALRGWYEHGGKNTDARSLSERTRGGGGDGALQGPLLDITQRYNVASLKDEHLGAGDGTLAIVKGTVKFIKNEPDKIAYPACKGVRDNRVCSKRLEQVADGWMCTNCGPQPGPEYRYMLSVVLQDATGEQFVTLFNSEAEQLLCIKAGDLLHALKTNGGETADPSSIPAYTRYFSDALWRQGLFSIRCKMDNRREEAKIQQNVLKLRLFGEGDSYVRESKALLENIHKYLS